MIEGGGGVMNWKNTDDIEKLEELVHKTSKNLDRIK
jgi:hypothetical protein